MPIKKILLLVLVQLSFAGQSGCFAQSWDVRILESINPQHPTSVYWQNTSKSVYYFTGAAAFGTLIYGFADNNERAKQNATELFISVGVSTLFSDVMKKGFHRERPADRYPGMIFASSPVHDGSFPSGHSTLAFNTATTLALDYPKWYVAVPAFLWAGSVGYSRMYLGKHYPSDVLGGAAVGIGSAYIGRWLNKAIFKPYNTKHQQLH
jgi:membrane-associated phospholipid phosphatase